MFVLFVGWLLFTPIFCCCVLCCCVCLCCVCNSVALHFCALIDVVAFDIDLIEFGCIT